jgi:hypothetical protein
MFHNHSADAIGGFVLTFAAWLSYLWANVYPVITGLSALEPLI